MTATAHALLSPATRLPWSLFLARIACGESCDGRLTMHHDGQLADCASAPGLYCDDDTPCDLCGRLAVVRDFTAIKGTLDHYRCEGAWPRWSAERGGVLTVYVEQYFETHPDWSGVGQSRQPAPDMLTEMLSDSRGVVLGVATQEEE